jgi:hypothetical protein
MSEQQSTKRTQRVIDQDRYRHHKRKRGLWPWRRRGRRWAMWISLYALVALLIWLMLGRVVAPPQ